MKKNYKKEEKEKMWKIFQEIWKKRKHRSEISGEWLGNEPLTIFFHHILPKSKYKSAIFDEDNIILMTWNEHTRVENDPLFFEEINKRREKLKMKYDRNP